MPVKVRPLQRQLEEALGYLPRPLAPDLDALNFVLVDRATMARVHADFLGAPTETDVITFPYGEILVCPAVAHERAGEFDLSAQQEVLLYCLHGMLHLSGYDDTTKKLAAEMAQAQMRLLKQVIDIER